MVDLVAVVDTEEGVPGATELRGNVVLAIAVLALAVFTGEDAEWMEISKDIGRWEGYTDLVAKRNGATRAMIEKRILDGGSWC